MRPEPGPSTQTLVKNFKLKALGHIAGLLDAMFDSSQQRLNTLAPSDPELAREVQTLQALLQARADMTASFVETLSHALANAAPAPAVLEDDAGLEQVIEQMCARADSGTRESFTALKQHMAGLPDSTGSPVSAAGLTPLSLCLCLQEAMSQSGFEAGAQHKVFEQFEYSVLAELATPYRQLQAFLQQQKVTPPKRRSEPSASSAHQSADHGAMWSRRMRQLQREVFSEDHFATSELLAVLSQLEFDGVCQAEKAIDTVRTQLLDQQSDSVPRSLRRNDRRIVGLLALLFNRLHTLAESRPDLAALLVLLRAPVTKIALIDPGFFMDPAHPARRLVNEIAALAVLPAAQTAATVVQAKALASCINTGFDSDPSLLVTAAEEIQTMTAAIELPSPQTTLAHARQIALLELHQQSLGRSLPDGISAFLRKGWAPVMAQRYIRFGAQSTQWDESGWLLARLINAVDPAGKTFQDDTGNAPAPGELAAQARQRLRELSLGQTRTAELLEGLRDSLNQAVSTPQKPHKKKPASLEELDSDAADDQVFDDAGSHDAATAGIDSNLLAAPKPEN